MSRGQVYTPAQKARNAERRRAHPATPAQKARAAKLRQARHATPDGRAVYSAATARRDARRRSRTTDQADADFAAKWPSGKPCVGCGELLPAEAFARNWITTDGRTPRCDRNGCRYRHERAKKLARLGIHWQSRGLSPSVCAYCGAAPIEHVDHFWPVARGGRDHPDNFVGACGPCNLCKSDRLPFEYLAAEHPDRVEFFQTLFNLDGAVVPLETS